MLSQSPHMLVAESESAARELAAEIAAIDGDWRTATVADWFDAPRQIEACCPEIVTLALDGDPEAALVFLQRIRSRFPAMAVIAVARNNAPEAPDGEDERETFQMCRAAFRAGATEFLTRPLSEAEWAHAMQTARTQPGSDGEPRKGKLIVFLGACGGVGVSTVACNTAVSLAAAHPDEAVLVDWNFRQGDVSVILDCHAKYSIADLLYADAHSSSLGGRETGGGRLDESLMRSATVKHASGLSILVQPDLLDFEDEPDTGRGAELFSTLQRMYRYVLVDAGRGVQHDNAWLIKQANTIVLLGTQDIPSIHNVRRTMAMLGELDIDMERVRYVLNRYDKHHRISARKAASATEMPVADTIPYDRKSLPESVNSGQPVNELFPRSSVAKSFSQLAGSLNGAAPTKPKPRGFSFFRRRPAADDRKQNSFGDFES